MNVIELIQSVRDCIAEAATAGMEPKQWPDVEIHRNLVSAQNSIWAEAIKQDDNYGLSLAYAADLGAQVSGTIGGHLRVTFPMEVNRIKYFRESASDTHQGIKIHKMEAHQAPRFAAFGGLYRFYRRGWMYGRNDREIYFTSPTTPMNLDCLLVAYLRVPPPMVVFQGLSSAVDTIDVDVLHGTQKLFDGTTGLGKLLMQTGVYIGSYIECINAGGLDPQGRTLEVQAYAEASYGNWQMTVDDHSGGAQGAIWATKMFYPIEQLELIALMAAARCLDKSDDVAGRTIMESRLAKKLQEFRITSERRDLDAPRYVNKGTG